jgi:hypothetical protein
MLGYQPFGKLQMYRLFHQNELRHVGAKAKPWQVLAAFVQQTEAVASRVAFGRNGILLLTTVPGDPNSGAFYFWHRNSKFFYLLDFERQATFNVSWFDIVVTSYDLQDLLDAPAKPKRKATEAASNFTRRSRGTARRPFHQGVAA